ncbi:MAG: undecaprenyl-diphosphate phosphatase [Eubacterium sp.]|nr:undecaprenyl-diphosphate phosphatase [Eubacterium sp.]
MSIITSIFQAILQAISYIIPISESGHSAIYHDLAGKTDGTVAALTGVIHLGMALGIFAAMLRLCLRLAKELGGCAGDLLHRDFSYREASPARRFLLSLMLSFAPLLLWLIPVNHNFSYEFLRRFGFNRTLLDEGLFLAITGALVLMALRQLTLGKNRKSVSALYGLLAGAVVLVSAPLSGLTVIGGVFAFLVLFGVTKKQALNFALVMSIPLLIGTGIAELATAAVRASAVQVILALVLSAVFAFLSVRVLKFLINKRYIKYIGYYDVSLGAITAVVGIVQLIVRN